MKVLHISTHRENCGIGKYQEQYLEAFSITDPKTEHAFFPYSPNKIKKMSPAELEKVVADLNVALRSVDLVHIQHELSFYDAHFLSTIVSMIKAAGVPLVSTIHTKVMLSEEVVGSRLSPFYWRRKIGSSFADKKVIDRFMPLAKSDKIIVHNNFTKQSLVSTGFQPDTISVFPIPVPEINTKVIAAAEPEAKQLLAPLSIREGDVLIATAGYLNGVKGTFHAVKAMRGLADHYKLAIIGGLHPESKDERFLDEIADYIYDNKLEGRVLITGSPENDVFNAAIKMADIVIYPYLRLYASSSAALNNAFALGKPIIGFPAPAFVELNKEKAYMDLCASFSYYDLIKTIKRHDASSLARLSALSKEYTRDHSYNLVSKKITELYKTLVK